MPTLRRVIGFPLLLLLAINALLGSDIFFVPGIAAGLAGPSSLIAWISIGIFAMLMACFFAEMVSTWPRAGGIYEYAKHGLNEPSAFIVGWLAWLVGSIIIATELVGGLIYLLPLAPLWMVVVVALGLLAAFSAVALRGMKLSAVVLLAFGVATLITLLAFIFIGLPAVNPANFSPFWVAGLPAVGLAAFFITNMFFGWEGMTYLAEEVKDPRKTVPRALLIATGALAILGVAVAIVSMGIMRWDVLAQSGAPLASAAESVMPSLSVIMRLMAGIAIIGTAASWVVFAPRLLFAMARDNMFIHGVQKLHPKWDTPYLAIALQTVVTAVVIIISSGSIRTLFDIIIPMYVLLYFMFLLCYVRLRDLPIKREFVAPFRNIGPPILVIVLVVLMTTWLGTPGAPLAFTILIVLLLCGFPSYIAIKLQTDRAFVEKFWNSMSVALNIYVPLLIGGHWSRVEKDADIDKRHTVLDYGCGAGYLTERFAKKAERVVAVDISEKQLNKALARISHAELANVMFVKVSRPAPFPANSFDRIVCTLAINYFVEPKKELAALVRTLKRGGKALFLAVHAPGITSHAFLKHDRTIKTVFDSAGFKRPTIERTKSLGREYIYISAEK